MSKRVKEIIKYLLDPASGELADPTALYRELEEMGYTLAEIAQALNMLEFENDFDQERVKTCNCCLNRVLSESEKFTLSTLAQGYLLKLYKLGWVSEAKLSLVIESATQEFSPPVSLDEIKEVASRYIIDLPEETHVDRNPHGKRMN